MDLGARKITWRTGLDMSWWAARVKWEGRRNICEVACVPDENWVRCKNFIFLLLAWWICFCSTSFFFCSWWTRKEWFQNSTIFIWSCTMYESAGIGKQHEHLLTKVSNIFGFQPKSRIYLINKGSRGKRECMWGRAHSQAFGIKIWKLLFVEI